MVLWCYGYVKCLVQSSADVIRVKLWSYSVEVWCEGENKTCRNDVLEPW